MYLRGQLAAQTALPAEQQALQGEQTDSARRMGSAVTRALPPHERRMGSAVTRALSPLDEPSDAHIASSETFAEAYTAADEPSDAESRARGQHLRRLPTSSASQPPSVPTPHRRHLMIHITITWAISPQLIQDS